MCTLETLKWAALNLRKEEVAGRSVLEVGSMDINGSVRYILQLLEPAEYVGVDIAPGPAVDVVCEASRLVERFGDGRFDVVVSACTLEHVRDWKSAVSNMKRVCRTGGVIATVVPSTHFPYHDYPGDYWRFEPDDLRDIFGDCEELAAEKDAAEPPLVYSKVRKPADFAEKDLGPAALFSIMTGCREREVLQEHFRHPFLRRKLMQNRIQGLGERLTWRAIRVVCGLMARFG